MGHKYDSFVKMTQKAFNNLPNEHSIQSNAANCGVHSLLGRHFSFRSHSGFALIKDIWSTVRTRYNIETLRRNSSVSCVKNRKLFSSQLFGFEYAVLFCVICIQRR